MLPDYSTYIAENINLLSQQKTRIIELATELVGSPAVHYSSEYPELGQSSENGFDCSGFVGFVLRHAGLYIPNYIGADGTQRPIRHANEFWDYYGVPIGSEPEAGDLIFFSRHGYFPTHVGIVRDSESYIHSPGKNDMQVVISSIEAEAIIARQGLGRILYRSNPIGFKAPTKSHDNPTYRYHQQLV